MRILITNDDGVYSPGIAALAQVASRFGEARIVAPDVEMSSASHAITSSRPLTYKRTRLPVSVRHYGGKVIPGKEPMGRVHYWYTVVPIESTDEVTDRWAIEQSYVSMTPLRIDLTDEALLEKALAQDAPRKVKLA